MTWTTYRSADVAFNATFGGYEGNFTMTPAWTLDTDLPVKINTENGYVTQIEYMGRIFQHQNATGANIHGGSHTTDDWLTFDIGQFYLVNEDGSMNWSIPLNSKPGWNGAHTITLSGGGSVPCFLEGVRIAMMGGDEKPVEEIAPGDMVATLTGAKRVLWVGGSEVKITDKNRPYCFGRTVVSPHHRVLIPGKGLIAAKHHPASASSPWRAYGRHDSVRYHHFLLETHSIVWADGELCESLWPGKETLRMLGDAFTDLIDVEEYCKHPAAPFLNKRFEVKK